MAAGNKRLHLLRHETESETNTKPFHLEIKEMQEAFPQWRKAFDQPDPVYAIPRPACQELTMRQIFPLDAVSPEMQFADICWRHGYIGAWRSWPIAFGPLRTNEGQFTTV